MISYHRTAGDTSEHVVCAKRCRLLAVIPDLTTTGTVTLRNAATTGGSNVVSVSAIGLLQQGKHFDGATLDSGLTVQLSVGTDLCTIVYEAF